MNNVYTFEYIREGTRKEVSISKREDATLEELRSLFYDWLACIGYQVQSSTEITGGTNE